MGNRLQSNKTSPRPIRPFGTTRGSAQWCPRTATIARYLPVVYLHPSMTTTDSCASVGASFDDASSLVRAPAIAKEPYAARTHAHPLAYTTYGVHPSETHERASSARRRPAIKKPPISRVQEMGGSSILEAFLSMRRSGSDMNGESEAIRQQLLPLSWLSPSWQPRTCRAAVLCQESR